MCGIFGGSEHLLNSNVESLLAHRGPDQHGVCALPLSSGGRFVMGQTRLSVVCRAEVPVPMSIDGATIVFNGEIYNWLQIRSELESLGHVFFTETDTEVALRSYLQWGYKCLGRFNGMFAMAIWYGGELFLARDRLGKKPLFYTKEPDGFAFCSEIKGMRHLCYGKVDVCDALEFYFDEHTPFENVKSIPPGHFAFYNPSGGIFQLIRWWAFPEPTGEIDDDKVAVDEFISVFTDACSIRALADVPLTVFLSGGIDSSLIQAVLRLDVSYTVQFVEFEKQINEEGYVREFSSLLGFEPRFVRPTKRDFDAFFPDIARSIEVPVGSFSVFPLYCLAKAAKSDGFTVALSGEGADELFCGYYRNELLLKESSAVEQELSGPYAELCGRYFGSDVDRFCRMANRHSGPPSESLTRFFASRWRGSLSFAQNINRQESMVFLQPLLTMADRLSMANSLEIRNPFLDHRVVELSCKLSDRMKFRDGQGKWVLRRALETLVGKDLGICNRKVKHGLPSPVNRWLFNNNAFDRRDWNSVLLGECLRQLAAKESDR